MTGELTLGMMLSLSFIIGQISGPIGSFIGFVHSYQDAKISMERISDVNNQDDEFKDCKMKLSSVPEQSDLFLDHVSFSYSGSERKNVINDVSISIPYGRVTAIVGASGLMLPKCWQLTTIVPVIPTVFLMIS